MLTFIIVDAKTTLTLVIKSSHIIYPVWRSSGSRWWVRWTQLYWLFLCLNYICFAYYFPFSILPLQYQIPLGIFLFTFTRFPTVSFPKPQQSHFFMSILAYINFYISSFYYFSSSPWVNIPFQLKKKPRIFTQNAEKID